VTTVADELVKFQDLGVRYGALQALHGLTGGLARGATGLLGPNGAGKTSLLKVLLGFVTPDSGSLLAFGLDPRLEPLEVRRRIGYMPEGDCHLPGLSATSYVAFAGELSGLPRAEAVSRAHEVLYLVGLEEARYRPVDGYSTGMKQRAKLAQALVHDPELLLLDEPTNGLDPGARDEMLGLIAEIAGRGRTSVVLCSHLLPDVERVCERVIVLDQGRVATSGSIAELAGLRRVAYDVRVSVQQPGDANSYLTDLRDLGCECVEREEGFRVGLPDGRGPELLFEAARDCGVQVRYLRPATETLEDVFLRAVGRPGLS